MTSSFKSVLSAITSLTPPPSSNSPYSLSALIDSPRSGEKHTKFYPVNECEYDTDSPSCYDSDSLLDFTTSSYLESIDTLDTSVSWYCRGDEREYRNENENENEDMDDDLYSGHGHGDEDDEIRFALRSGERTPLSPTSALDSPLPLLDSKVFILRPVRLLNDDFDFTCAGPEEASSLGVRVRYQLQHPHHPHHHHHHHHIRHPRRHNKNNTNINLPPREPEHHQQQQQQQEPSLLPSNSESNVISPQSKPSKLQSASSIDYARRRWSAPSSSSPHSSMLTQATTLTGTLLETPLSLSQLTDYSELSCDSQDQQVNATDSSIGSDSLIVNCSHETRPPREKKQPLGDKANTAVAGTRAVSAAAGLQTYTISDAQNQILTSRLKALEISSTSQPIQRKTSSSSIDGTGNETPTPKTWSHPHYHCHHRRRQSEAFFYHLKSELPDITNNTGFNAVDGPVVKKRSQTMQLFCASNKWGNQPPNGYI